MEQKQYDILAMGEILIDFIPAPETENSKCFLQKAGGAPLNLLATASKYGCKTAFLGKVGKDMFGNFLRKTVTECGISDAYLQTDAVHNTTLAFVSLDEKGDRDFSFYRNFGADTFLREEDIPKELFSQTAYFHFGSLSFTAEPAKSASERSLSYARENNCIITYDANYRPPLWKSEKDALTVMRENMRYPQIVKLSKEEAMMIADYNDFFECSKKILDTYKNIEILLITDGANGVNYSTQNLHGFVPSLSVKPIDTTGAGDIFFGTFLSCMIKYQVTPKNISTSELHRFVEIAVQASGKSTLKKGAIASIPDISELL